MCAVSGGTLAIPGAGFGAREAAAYGAGIGYVAANVTLIVADAIDNWMHSDSAEHTQAPGIPTLEDGFKPAKNWDGESKTRAKNSRGYGYPAKAGGVWVPTGSNPSRAHGGPHWNIQHPNVTYENVCPGGKTRGGPKK